MEALEAMQARYACRDFLEEPLAEAEVTALLNAASASPAAMGDYSGMLLTVIQDPALRALIDRETAHAMPMMSEHPTYRAPALFLISVKPNEAFPVIPYCNAACMAENLMVQASALGLASVFIMAVPTVMAEKPALLERLALGEGFVPAVMVAIGKPRQARAAAQKTMHPIPIIRQ